MSALDVSRDVGVEVYECNFEPADLHDPLDDIETAPARPAKPYDPLDELGVPRDQWGRPLLLPDPAWGLAPTIWPDGKIEKRQMADGRRHFARVSTAAGWNDIAHGLTLWRQRMALLALARRPDLQAELAGLVYKDGKRIDAITDELLIRAADDGIDIDEAIKVKPGETHVPMGGTLSAASRGTAWHALTVPGAPVIDPIFGPTLMQYEVTARAFDEALERCGLELLVHERLGVDYARRLAGTVDHLARVVKETKFSTVAGLDVGSVIVLDKKGLPLDTPLPTPDGWTTMGDVKPGDKLFSSNGQVCTVRSKSEVHLNPCARITFDDGSSVVCDDEHRWVVEVGPLGRARRGVLSTLDLISARASGTGPIRIRMPEPLDLPDADLPIPPWVLGVWLGDGKHTSAEVSKPDAFIWEEIRHEGFKLGADTGRDCPTRTVKGLRGKLSALGLLGNKHIPATYLRASFKQRLALLQGLLDTDGCWAKLRKNVIITLTDHALADQVAELALSLGQRVSVCNVRYSGFGVTGVARTVCFRPRGIDPFRLPRKAELVEPCDERAQSHHRTVRSIETVPTAATQCIEVDSPDRTYLCTERMIPTHNTGKTRWITHATQLAMYSHCRPHDWRTGETRDWHPDLVPDVGGLAAASIETGKVKIYSVKTPAYLADSAVERYRLSLSEHVNSLVGKGF
jgi:hypothetical protein